MLSYRPTACQASRVAAHVMQLPPLPSRRSRHTLLQWGLAAMLSRCIYALCVLIKPSPSEILPLVEPSRKLRLEVLVLLACDAEDGLYIREMIQLWIASLPRSFPASPIDTRACSMLQTYCDARERKGSIPRRGLRVVFTHEHDTAWQRWMGLAESLGPLCRPAPSPISVRIGQGSQGLDLRRVHAFHPDETHDLP